MHHLTSEKAWIQHQFFSDFLPRLVLALRVKSRRCHGRRSSLNNKVELIGIFSQDTEKHRINSSYSIEERFLKLLWKFHPGPFWTKRVFQLQNFCCVFFVVIFVNNQPKLLLLTSYLARKAFRCKLQSIWVHHNIFFYCIYQILVAKRLSVLSWYFQNFAQFFTLSTRLNIAPFLHRGSLSWTQDCDDRRYWLCSS